MIDEASHASPSVTEQPAGPPHQAGIQRWALVLIMVLVAAAISGVAGLLSHAAGNNIPAAILTGGGAFAGSLGVLLAIAHYADAR
jgi:hypothetical protein